MESDMRVKFTEDFLYESEGRGKGPSFKSGDVKEFRDDIAQRFINRGVAVQFNGKAEAPAPAAKTTEKPPEKPPAAPTAPAAKTTEKP
jgi:hypothetical protein